MFVQLSWWPDEEELLIWCDYLEETRDYPPEVILWLRHVIAAGLTPWAGPCWDFDDSLCPQMDPDWANLGELPLAIWKYLCAPLECLRGIHRRKYTGYDEAWEDLAQAVAQLARREGISSSSLGETMYPTAVTQEAP
jgi:hypothetical protein